MQANLSCIVTGAIFQQDRAWRGRILARLNLGPVNRFCGGPTLTQVDIQRTVIEFWRLLAILRITNLHRDDFGLQVISVDMADWLNVDHGNWPFKLKLLQKHLCLVIRYLAKPLQRRLARGLLDHLKVLLLYRRAGEWQLVIGNWADRVSNLIFQLLRAYTRLAHAMDCNYAVDGVKRLGNSSLHHRLFHFLLQPLPYSLSFLFQLIELFE